MEARNDSREVGRVDGSWELGARLCLGGLASRLTEARVHGDCCHLWHHVYLLSFFDDDSLLPASLAFHDALVVHACSLSCALLSGKHKR